MDFFLGVWITGFLYELCSYLVFELKQSRYSKLDEWFDEMYAKLDTGIFWSVLFVVLAIFFFALWPFALANRISKMNLMKDKK